VTLSAIETAAGIPYMSGMQQIPLTISIPPDVMEVIARMAVAEERSRASMARRLLMRGLAEVLVAQAMKESE